ncbi:amidohydrolase [Leucobacter triazinivorans]|uniref:Amidohydrolase n=1 Tax=Leucobacter triazinivorans TaxID=1784719 RepID=A0A4P6KGQ0_9MICO|nr:amidohydrolase [Leucobacter triazinivorans]QBE48674.1 amidohydrolase [Leucobacter triazinivorans]
MSTTIYRGAAVFTADDAPARAVVEAFAVRDGRFSAVGTLDEVRAASDPASGPVAEVDLAGRFVAPGIIDSHTHLAGFGASLAKTPLRDCASLSEIQQRLLAARAADPEAARVLGIGWLFDAVGDGQPTAAMLDEVLPEVPVYLDANDLHSMWVNTAALREMGITRETPDPVGGEIARDADGEATGMLYETACTQYGWAFLEAASTADDLVHALDAAFRSYLAVGVTGATEMSLNAAEVSGLRTLIARDGRLPFPVTAHWILEPSGDAERDLAGITGIVALRDEIAASDAAEWLRIAGVKFIMDGVIDACTATMRAPYADGSNAEPIWTAERILPVAAAADRAGLQIAMHAIGDRTSEIALDAVEHCIRVNGPRPRRHRIEHLESVADTTIERMGELGVVASMQPVHCDPAVLDNWKAMLGDERGETGFPWQKFRAAGVPLTLGTDAPTAPHQPLPNLYIALTGGSVLAPELPPYHPERVFTPAEALTALTAGGAWAGEMEETCGRIRAGLDANFIVLDVNPLEAHPSALLDATVRSTHVRGAEAHRA